MSVIDKINNQELGVKILGYPKDKFSISLRRGAEKELIKLARLGAAALEAGYPCEPADENESYDIECVTKHRCKHQEMCRFIKEARTK